MAKTGAVIAVIATPAEAAQGVADRLVYLGVTSILNFAATVLVVPERVNVRKVDLGQELQILAYHEQRKTEDGVPDCRWPTSWWRARGTADEHPGGQRLAQVDLGRPSGRAGDGCGRLGQARGSARLLRAHRRGRRCLSTCNRTELYASVTRFHGALDAAVEALADFAGLAVTEVRSMCGGLLRRRRGRPHVLRRRPGSTRW